MEGPSDEDALSLIPEANAVPEQLPADVATPPEFCFRCISISKNVLGEILMLFRLFLRALMTKAVGEKKTYLGSSSVLVLIRESQTDTQINC